MRQADGSFPRGTSPQGMAQQGPLQGLHRRGAPLGRTPSRQKTRTLAGTGAARKTQPRLRQRYLDEHGPSACQGTARPRRHLEGCVAAFGAEFDYIHRSLRRHGISESDADDLAQEVFLIMWRRWPDYDAARPLRPWLAGIAFRVAYNHRDRIAREVPGGLVDTRDQARGPGGSDRLGPGAGARAAGAVPGPGEAADGDDPAPPRRAGGARGGAHDEGPPVHGLQPPAGWPARLRRRHSAAQRHRRRGRAPARPARVPAGRRSRGRSVSTSPPPSGSGPRAVSRARALLLAPVRPGDSQEDRKGGSPGDVPGPRFL